MPNLALIRRLRPSTLLVLLTLSAGAAPACAAGTHLFPLDRPASAPPEIAFDQDAVVVTGLAPNADVILHGVSRYRDTYYWAVLPTDEALTADETGTIRYEVPDGLAPFSVWAAVDAATGAFAIGKPEGSVAREVPFPNDGLAQAPGGVVSGLHTSWERVEVLFVRPGAGAWRGVGLSGNEKAPPAGAEVDLASALPIQAATAAPTAGLTPGDVVMAVNPSTLEYFAARLMPPGQQP